MKNARSSRANKTNEKNSVDSDVLIQGTNDSSIVSKRSVERLYCKDQNTGDFLRYFVTKPIRRSPIINRGYWTRMKAVEHIINSFLDTSSSKTSVIVNLGCGFDPYAFQHIHQHGRKKNIVFVDVDYPELIAKKVKVIQETENIKNLVGRFQIDLNLQKSPVFTSENYIALPCDLRETDYFFQLLKQLFSVEQTRFLFTAEVSLTYMENQFSDKLIEKASEFPDSQFALLEQLDPSSCRHPFTETMLEHFNKLNTPIHSLRQYHTKYDQKNRFLNLGWKSVGVEDLYEFWQSHISENEKSFVESVEEFDELEEFVLFCQHYFILHACTKENAPVALSQTEYRDTQCDSEPAYLSSVAGHSIRRRFAASCRYNDLILQHGGFQNTRLRTTTVLSFNDKRHDFIESPDSDLSPRMCHTLSPFSHNKILLVGGRQNPRTPLKDCWIFDNGVWQSTHSLPYPRFRHAAVSVNKDQVLVFGGCQDPRDSSFCLWSQSEGWTLIPSDLPARSSCSMVWNDKTQEGFIIGGLNNHGQVAATLARFRLVGKKIVSEQIFEHELLARYGACAVLLDQSSIVLAGGVSPLGLLDQTKYFIRINLFDASISQIHVTLSNELCLPMPVGMNMERIDEKRVLLFGGGAVCFSFGSNWNGVFQLNLENDCSIMPLTISPPIVAENKVKRHITDIRRIENELSHEEFKSLCDDNVPFLMKNQNLGKISQWSDPEHLIEKVGAETQVVIHKSNSDNLNFQQKNFRYEKTTFSEFVYSAFSKTPGTYLRSLSFDSPRGKPAKFSTDFPGLAEEFKLPQFLNDIERDHFSSPLRIASPNTTVWLHYDVTANALCQIVGSKRVKMYPPTDVQYLKFPPGASSSSIDNIFLHEDHHQSHPLQFVMDVGDILYIPPMWLHALQALSPSVSVNFFWKNLSEQEYATGRDVYGNRDLAAYENGRQQIAHLVKSFSRVPADIRSFYLQRLGQELLDAGTDSTSQ